MAKKLNCLLRDFGTYLPVGWVAVSLDLGRDWIYRQFLHGLFLLFFATLAVALLHGLGVVIVAKNEVHLGSSEPPRLNLFQRLARIAGLLLFLYWFTAQIS